MTDTVPLAVKTPDIRDLLLEAVSGEKMRGGYNTCFAFPESHPELNGYLLRVPKRLASPEAFKEFLENSSSITPVASLWTGSNLGQALMQVGKNPNRDEDQVLIIKRQIGISLDRHLANLMRTHDTREGYKAFMHSFLSIEEETGINPFTKIFRESLPISRHCYPDFFVGNIFFDDQTKTLHLIDQFNPRLLNDPAPTPVRSYFRQEEDRLLEMIPRWPTDKEYTDLRNRYFKMVTNASAYVLEHPPTQQDRDKVGFSAVSNVEAVPLDHKTLPRVLVERLKQLDALTVSAAL